MPYLGRGLEKGNYLKLDDISSQFDGSKTTFNLTVGGSAHVPGSSYSLLVSLSGIVQEGEAAYTLDQNEITFAAAPQAADDCFIISLGTPLGIGVPSNGTVNGTQLAKPLNYDNFFHLDHINDRVGIGTSLPTQSLDVYDGNIAIRDPATASQFLGFYHNRDVLKASIDKTGNNLTFENVDSGIIDYKIGGSSRVSIGSTGKIFFGTDDDTYFYRPGADTLGFLTGGTERLRINSSGETKFTVGTNKSVKFYAASHNDETNLGAGLGFSRQSDGAEMLSGIFGHSNTGLGVAARDHITFLTGGTSNVSDTEERLRITSGGCVFANNIGVGTDNRWKIRPNSSFNQLAFEYSTGTALSDSNIKMLLNSDGNVGIGTNDPDTILHLQDSNHGAITLQGGTATSDLSLDFQTVAGVTTARIFSASDKGDLRFYTANTERFRITEGGGVGISTAGGTITPDGNALLIRAGSTVGTHKGHIMLTGDGATTNEGPQIVFSESGSGSNFVGGAIGFRRTGGNGVGDLVFGVRTVSGDATTPPTEVIRITSAKQVGIGTTNPGALLNVYGSPAELRLQHEGNSSYSRIISDSSNELKIFTGGGPHLGMIIDGSQNVGIGTNNPARRLHLHDQSSDTVQLHITNSTTGVTGNDGVSFALGSDESLIINQRESNDIVLKTDDTDRLRITSTGDVGIGINSPTAGDLKTGDTQNNPKFHIKGTAGAGTTFSDESSTGGEYNLLARFEAGGDADDTGSMIVLNHSNDRGLAIQGGRSTGNRSFGAIKSIDNVGRLSNVMAFGGDNGQGVEYLALYTGDAQNTTSRIHITSNGDIVTQGLTDYSFNNDNANTKILEVTGDGSVGEYGQINISGNQNSDNNVIGAIKFVNRENSSSGSGSNAASRQLGSIEMRTVTTDNNDGDDSGGLIRFITKAEGGSNASRLVIKSDGNIEIVDGNLNLANNHGISFSATSDHGTVTPSELFDDYEEGEWTPTIKSLSGTDPTISYTKQDGRYTKIGNVVYLFCFIDIGAGNFGTDGTGDGVIDGLPYTISNDPSSSDCHGSYSDNLKSIPNTFSAERNNAMLFFPNGAGQIRIHQYSTDNPIYQTGWALTQMDNGDRFKWGWTAQYRTGQS